MFIWLATHALEKWPENTTWPLTRETTNHRFAKQAWRAAKAGIQ
jgi:hypothetical protein